MQSTQAEYPEVLSSPKEQAENIYVRAVSKSFQMRTVYITAKFMVICLLPCCSIVNG